MKKAFFVFVMLLSLMCFASNQSYAAGDWTGNANIGFGSKALDEDDWKPMESQPEFGLDVDFGKKTWPVHIAIGYLNSSKDDTISFIIDGTLIDSKLDGSTRELRLGLKKIWEPAMPIRPYVGGGLALINAKIKMTLTDGVNSVSISQDDQAVGGYINGGIFWIIANKLNLGVDLGYSKASVKLYDIDVKAGGTHALFFIGYHW
jgi:hypothetical protein